MPELPEVETVRAGLEEIAKLHPKIVKVELKRGDVRFPIPKNFARVFQGQKILGVRRRAKYLLIDTPKAVMLSHLGMTGSWRLVENGGEDKHDHCYIELSDGRRLAFRDPRRFGVLDLIESGKETSHRLLKNLGVEPLEEGFNGEFLFRHSRKRKIAVKVFIMDQRVVVGVGNIYASEALFQARVRPTRKAGSLTRDECDRLVAATREILEAAILAGGSSIRDYRQVGGEEGGYQVAHRVYDRKGEPCGVCGEKIRAKVVGGRSTFWCERCQG
jgi:formamidopyrimidine-DNA glycosylase